MRKSLSSVLFILLSASALFADQNIPVQSRPESEETQKQTAEKRSEEIQLNKKHECDVQTQSGSIPRPYLPIYYNQGYHSIAAITDLGNSLILEDGSVWEIDPYFTNDVYFWNASDPLIIFPNNSFFSPYKYVIYNKTLGSQVEINMVYGPGISNPYAIRIIAIDYLQGEVFLSDNTRWYICESDMTLLDQWVTGDYIIVGTNVYSCCSLSNILINVNVYDHIYAQQF